MHYIHANLFDIRADRGRKHRVLHHQVFWPLECARSLFHRNFVVGERVDIGLPVQEAKLRRPVDLDQRIVHVFRLHELLENSVKTLLPLEDECLELFSC